MCDINWTPVAHLIYGNGTTYHLCFQTQTPAFFLAECGRGHTLMMLHIPYYEYGHNLHSPNCAFYLVSDVLCNAVI